MYVPLTLGRCLLSQLLMAGTYTVHIKQWEQFEPQDIALHGMFVFSLPCGAVGTGEVARYHQYLLNGR